MEGEGIYGRLLDPSQAGTLPKRPACPSRLPFRMFWSALPPLGQPTAAASPTSSPNPGSGQKWAPSPHPQGEHALPACALEVRE